MKPFDKSIHFIAAKWKSLGKCIICECAIIRGITVKLRDDSGDIIDSQEAEKALRESELWMRSVFDALEESVVIASPERVVKAFNPATERIFGYSKGEVVGASTEIFHVDHEHYVEFGNRIKNAFAKGQSAEFEYEAKRKNGEIFPSHHTVSLLRDRSGEPIGIASIVRDLSEHKKTHDALADSRKSFASIVEKSADGILVLDSRGKVLYANPSAAALLGYEEGGLKEVDFGTPVMSGEVETIQVMRPDSEIREVQMRIAPTDWFGQSAHVVLLRDMTEHLRHELALRKEKEQTEQYLNVAGVMFVVLDSNGKVVRVNRKACEVLGREHDELINQCWITTVLPVNKQQVSRYQFDHLMRGNLDLYEYVESPILTKSGEIRIISWHNALLRDQYQCVVGTVSSGEDITERKEMETRLAESEERHRVLFERSSDAILIERPDGEIVTANPVTAVLLGVSLEELTSLNMNDFFVNRLERMELQKELERRGIVKDYPIVVKESHGKEKHCLINASLWKDREGTVIGYLSMLRDITESRKLEEQLRQAQKMESIGTLAGGIAHDFNNILTIVQGYSEMLLVEKAEGDLDYSDLSAINGAAKRGAELVKQLLTFSRKVETDRRPVNLNQEVKTATKLLSRTIPKMIHTELVLAEDLRRINADPGQMEQIILNLAVNAKDAMPNGGTLTFETGSVVLDHEFCRTHPEAVPCEHVFLRVEDTGHGMTKDVVDRIFEPFFSTKKHGKGTGLGLAMVYGIVKNHGGHITCRSTPEVGTTFKIYFPVFDEGTVLPEHKIEATPNGGSETILLVDDEEMIRSLGEKLLQYAGYTVITAGDGEEALEIYRNRAREIDLVLLDVIMPGMGGQQALVELRKLNSEVRVIIVSGFLPQGPAQASTESNASGFVGKPFNRGNILKTVREVLER